MQKIIDDRQHWGSLQQPPDSRNVLKDPPPAWADLRTTSMRVYGSGEKTCQLQASTHHRTLRNPGRGGGKVAPVSSALVFHTYNYSRHDLPDADTALF